MARRSKKPRTCLVTGATGYIGSRLVARLLAEGWRVHALVRPDSRRDRLPQDRALSVHDSDGSWESFERAMVAARRVDVAFHLAAYAAYDVPPHCLRELVEANIAFGLHVLEALAQRGGALVNAGSFWQRWTAAEPTPNSGYAAAKQALEVFVDYYVRHRGVPAITLRLADVYGPGDWRGKLFDQLYAAARDGRIAKLSPGEQRLDLVHVEDAVLAFLAAADLVEAAGSPPQHRIFDVAAAESRTLRETVNLYARLLDLPLKLKWGARSYRLTEIMTPVIAERLPGWRPAIELEAGLREVIVSQWGARA